MNKAFENILDRLDKECIAQINYPGYVIDLEKANEIVQEVAEEYNGGWIPCSERLPQEKDGVVLICDENGEVGTGRYSEFSNQWYIGDMCAIGGSKVIAYKPLPEPYKEGE